MIFRYVCLVGLVILGLTMLQSASAEVWIPDNEFVGYFDSNGVYTVVGTVKNSEQTGVVSTVEVSVNDGDKTISQSYTLPAASPSKDMPFKIKFRQVRSESPILEKPKLTFKPVKRNATTVEVVYDSTLVKHPNGRVTGIVVNNGNLPAYHVKIYALIHGKDNKVLDMGQSVEDISKIEPGEKKQFTMYPDPLVAPDVKYYSCFVIGEDPVIPAYVMREGKRFNFRYVSSAYLDNLKFDDGKKTLSFLARNPWPLAVYANIELPRESETQNYKVFINDQPVYAPVSTDGFGNWHIAFNLDHQGSYNVLITGFGPKDESVSQILKNSYYLLGIIPIAAVIVGIYIKKKKN